MQSQTSPASKCISIHALREERDIGSCAFSTSTSPFQSTRSARSATCLDRLAVHAGGISIHALREERDLAPSLLTTPSSDFNPRAPRGARRSRSCYNQRRKGGISIHALREERDTVRRGDWPALRYFNPRAPRGARHRYDSAVYKHKLFQSTRSARSATKNILFKLVTQAISIHALREERDLLISQSSTEGERFQSTRSARSATYHKSAAFFSPAFQSTRSARSATTVRFSRGSIRSDFNPRAPRGARRGELPQDGKGVVISIHALREERDGNQCGYAEGA